MGEKDLGQPVMGVELFKDTLVIKISGVYERWALDFGRFVSESFPASGSLLLVLGQLQAMASYTTLSAGNSTSIILAMLNYNENVNLLRWHPLVLLPPSIFHPLIAIPHLPAESQTSACEPNLAFCHVFFSMYNPPLSQHGNHWYEARACYLC